MPRAPEGRPTTPPPRRRVRNAGRTREAIDLLERVFADRERLLGPEHPDTLTIRDTLAALRREAGLQDP